MTRWFLALTAAISRGISLFNACNMDQSTHSVVNASCSFLDHEERIVEKKKRPPPLDLSSPVLAGAEVIVEPRVPLKCASQRSIYYLRGSYHDASESGEYWRSERGERIVRSWNGRCERAEKDRRIDNTERTGHRKRHINDIMRENKDDIAIKSISSQPQKPLLETLENQKPNNTKSNHVALIIASDP